MAQRRMTKEQRTRQLFMRCALLLLFVLSVLFVGLYIVFQNSGKTEINLNDCTTPVLSGFNKEGHLEARIDVTQGYDAFFDTVKVNFSKSEGLCNGDEVIMSFEYSEEIAKQYRLKVIAREKSFVIKDLVDPVVLSKDELFDGVSVEYDGVAPLVQPALSVSNKYDSFVSYEIIDNKEYYDIGDSVRVRAVYSDEELAARDYVAEVESTECIKEFNVETVDRYVTDAADMTEDMMASLKKEALTLFTDADANEYGMRIFCDAHLMPVYINKKTTFTWTTPNFISAYLDVLKEESYGKTGTYGNDLKMCYEVAITQADGVACNAEVVVRFSDIIIRQDGTVDLNFESGEIISADRRDSHIKAIVQNQFDDDYETLKL